MIYQIKGDAVAMLNNMQIDGLAHCCNAVGVMGAGIAKQIRETFPTAYNAYMKNHNELEERGTQALMGTVSSDGKVFNIVGQENVSYGIRQLHYGYFVKGLLKVRKMVEDIQRINLAIFDVEPPKYKLAVPRYIGCNLAGGDWEVMFDLLMGLMGDSQYFDLYIVDYEQGE